ncbi:MAG: DUF4349 domain-containing protein [Treponema sp.]|nr:DUF4349 domain-containing protein [Treponema sp.]
MKKKIIIITLLTAFLFTFGCSRKMDGGGLAAERVYMQTPGLAYDDSATTTQWAGAGFNYKMSAAFEEQTPPAFRDMSNLYGRMTADEDSMSADLSNVERKLVKTANILIRVENLEAADAFVTDLMGKYDAYAASTNVEENSYYYVLRVPSRVYDIFLTEMNGMGRLIRRSENTEDVTLRYYDLEGRLETKKELLRTFQSYLGRANNIEEILKVEARISELQYDIEGTGKQLRDLANRVDYATVELNLLGPAAAISNRSVTFGEQIKQLFGGFGGFLSGLAVALIGIVIYGIPILLLLVLFFWLFFGRIGLMKKLWQIVKGKNQA